MVKEKKSDERNRMRGDWVWWTTDLCCLFDSSVNVPPHQQVCDNLLPFCHWTQSSPFVELWCDDVGRSSRARVNRPPAAFRKTTITGKSKGLEKAVSFCPCTVLFKSKWDIIGIHSKAAIKIKHADMPGDLLYVEHSTPEPPWHSGFVHMGKQGSQLNICVISLIHVVLMLIFPKMKYATFQMSTLVQTTDWSAAWLWIYSVLSCLCSINLE